MKHIIKKIINKILNSRNAERVEEKKDWSKYFNNGKPPLEQNTTDIYDKFYADHEMLKIYYNEPRIKFYKDVVSFINEKRWLINNSKILDVGCGNGHLVNELSQVTIGNYFSGCDFSIKGIEFASNIFPKFHFFQHDILKPLQEKYDFIICTEVLEHILEVETALENILDALEINGSIFFTVPNGRADTLEEHINFWSLESWGHFFERNAGHKFKVECGYLGNHLFARLTL